MTAMLPAHLTESVNSLGDAARTMSEEIRLDRKQRAAENRRMLSLLLVVLVLVAGLATLSISNRRLGQANSTLNRQNSRIVERIESCTTVGGECYKENAKQTQGAIAQLTALTLQGEIAVARCAQTTDTDDALEQCVRHYLATQPLPPISPPATPAPKPGTPVPSPSS